MTSLLVVLLGLAAGAALTAQLVWWMSNRRAPRRVPPPLVVPIHAHYRRHPEARDAVAASDAHRPFDEQPLAKQSAEALPTETVQFRRPGDEALQLLPARLEVVAGMTSRAAIRFVRLPGQPPEMILGREASSSPQQVTLTSSTVSRRHARVRYSDGRWQVTNLSRTNPVVVNDETLVQFESARALFDGDRIELGEVVLRFCTS